MVPFQHIKDLIHYCGDFTHAGRHLDEVGNCDFQVEIIIFMFVGKRGRQRGIREPLNEPVQPDVDRRNPRGIITRGNRGWEEVFRKGADLLQHNPEGAQKTATQVYEFRTRNRYGGRIWVVLINGRQGGRFGQAVRGQSGSLLRGGPELTRNRDVARAFFGLGDVVSGLHPIPGARAAAEYFAHADGHFQGEAGASGNQFRQFAGGDAKRCRGFRDGEAEGFDALVKDNWPRMGRVLQRHFPCSCPLFRLMIVYQIDIASIWAGESKDHAPVAGHGDCPIAGKVAHQGMQVEPRFVHIHVIPGLLQTRACSH